MLLAPQDITAADLPGRIELVDLPPAPTPINEIRFHRLEDGYDVVSAQVDRSGQFLMRGVAPGWYSLLLAVPGRIKTFGSGSKTLDPSHFQVQPGDSAPLRLVVSLKTSELAVEVEDLSKASRDVVALLAPADPYLTHRESCYLNTLTGSRTTFRFVPPGQYRVFIIDKEFSNDAAQHAPKPDFLKAEATVIQVGETSETRATAKYLDSSTVRGALKRVQR